MKIFERIDKVIKARGPEYPTVMADLLRPQIPTDIYIWNQLKDDVSK